MLPHARPLLALLLLAACGEPTQGPVDLHGAAQKGPFLLGSSVTAAPLDPQGAPTGLQFESAAASDLGEFTFTAVPAGPVALLATGFHFDEVRGGRSLAPIALRALHLASGDTTTANIHVLTHLAEARARALFAQGAPLAAALADAEASTVAALQIGPPGLSLAAPAAEANILGPDSDDDAYLFAVSAVLAQAAHTADPGAPDAALQELLNRLAADLADDAELAPSLVDQLAAAETQLDAGLVRTHLADRAGELGLPAQVPDLNRALDQDHDGLANHLDNCPHHANLDQADEDGDAIGDPCDPCLASPGDGDGDGVQDKCDSCPAVANPEQSMGGPPYDDPDADGLGNACDSCNYSKLTGAVPGENCCDPRIGDCTRWAPTSSIFPTCYPRADGLQFECTGDQYCLGTYGGDCEACSTPLCVAPGALTTCDLDRPCGTRWCTVGDTSCDAEPGDACVPWYHPGEAPAGLADLGICARPDAGPCAGKVGRECAVWNQG